MIGSILIVGGLYAVLWGKAKEMEKIVEIPKRDSDEGCNNQELSGHPENTISNSNELIINTHHRNFNELAASELKKPVRESDEICCGKARNDVAIECSTVQGETHGDDRIVSAGEASVPEVQGDLKV